MTDAIEQKVASFKWFHSIDFGSFASSGRFPDGKPQNITLYPAFDFLKSLDLEGSSVLDVGTYDGLVAFGASALGAAEVVGADTFDHQTFRLARNLLGLEQKVKYEPKKQVRDLVSTFSHKRFDVIVCAGVIYHMLYPMQAFVQPRLTLKDGGYLIMETPFKADSDRATLAFNGVEEEVAEPYTYFVPTRSALIGMANLVGFSVEGTRELTGPKRITLLLKAVNREVLIEDENVAPYIKQMLKRDTCDDEFRFRDLEALPAAAAAVSKKVQLEFDATVNPSLHKPSYPYHPPKERRRLGSTRFETERGNLKVL